MRNSLGTQSNLKVDVEPIFAAPKEVAPQRGTALRAMEAFRPSGVDSDTFAASSRRAGRINAASASEDEVKSLLRERRELLAKKFDGTLTKVEGHRLQLVRWNLDRIEDARHGQHLERLENAVVAYEKFQGDVERLIAEIESVKVGKK